MVTKSAVAGKKNKRDTLRSFMKKLLLALLICLSSFAANYPEHWWQKVDENDRQGSWEILPHECKKGVELILSKRNELGVFSNFGHTPFTFEGEHYQSIEGLWQMMKYPELNEPNDPRHLYVYPYTRNEVKDQHGFEAKKAGDLANVVNRNAGINWVSYKGKRFNYKDFAEGSRYHLDLMKRAIRAKVMQNPEVKKLLIKTGDLTLLPDHKQGNNVPPSYLYFKILMQIRSDLKKEISLSELN
tara:strand:- start:65899 stop:66627 length:729 start_codon:yes stop_codon:yes gene_type:complete